MSDEMVAPEQTEEKETWRLAALAIGGTIGALIGLGAAFLLVQNAERQNIKKITVSGGDMVRLGVLVFGLLRQVALIGEGK
jgi:hypothetical protein